MFLITVNYKRMIGLKRNTVKLVPHAAVWADIFENTKNELTALLGSKAIDIQHIGSTSINKIKAKPILDIALLVNDIVVIEELILLLACKEYEYRGDKGENGGHLFIKNSGIDIRTHHLHIIEKRDPQWEDFLYFRDMLRNNDQLANEYEKVKVRLEALYSNNRLQYTKGKNEFIKKVIQKRHVRE
jgi:GrpB-like predicted nucleotidyltransferase (UPF0157 family)